MRRRAARPLLVEVLLLRKREEAGLEDEIPEFGTLAFGFQKFQATEAWTVWMDEVAFNEERVGCNN